MALSPQDLALTQTRLAEAKAALHQIMIGQGVQRVQDQNGESVTYSTANASRLRSYIAELEALVRGCSLSSGPIRPVFL